MTTLETLQEILRKEFNLEPAVLQPEARLEDLEIDSLAVVEVLFAVEDTFKVMVPAEPVAQQSNLKTIGDLVAYIDRIVAEQHPGAPERDPS